jgi:hypothetical protein
MQHARMVWLTVLRMQEQTALNYTKRIVLSHDFTEILEPQPTAFDCFARRVRDLYHRGVAALASADPEAVQLAYDCFVEVRNELTAVPWDVLVGEPGGPSAVRRG